MSPGLKIANFIGFQLGWFTCILSAAAGRPLLGIVAASALITLHLWTQRFRTLELLLIAGVGAYGYIADSALVFAGQLAFPDGAVIGGPSPFWMVCLWMLFACTLHGCLAWLQGRYVLGMLFGAIGGPIAYYAGFRLGAVQLADPLWQSSAWVAVEYAIAMPVLLSLAWLTGAEANGRAGDRFESIAPCTEATGQ